jgi:two-component system, chemotaxis family, CheB/CheR fusion protein
MSKSATKKQNKASNPVARGRKPRPNPTAKETLPITKNKVPAALPHPAPGEPCIVGVGASAGGFEPIKTLLSMMPPDSGLAFVVIQHLDPAQKSLATELFAKRTRMAVAEAEDGMRVQAGHVYTVPAGRQITIQGGILHVATAKREYGHRMPIDHFFHSL